MHFVLLFKSSRSVCRPQTRLQAVCFEMMNCHHLFLTSGDDPVHAGLDISMCIQTSTFLPPSLIPPSLLSICPSSSSSSLQPSLNKLEGRHTNKSPDRTTEGPTVVSLSCVCVCVFDTEYVSIYMYTYYVFTIV